MRAEEIYEKLRSAGLSHAGACGLIANFEAESALRPDNLQNSFEKKLGFVDGLYTQAVDSGSYTDFAADGAGYGYAQWSYGPRKKNLMAFARERGVSIGDGEMQLDFALQELRTEYAELLEFLCGTDDLYEATARVCKEYERPAVNNIAARYEYAQSFDRELGGAVWFPPDLSIMCLQAVLVANGYNTEISGYKNADFFAKLREFAADIGA